MTKNRAVLAVDTSNYTTSAAIMDPDGRLLAEQRRLLEVPSGKRGLRQSDALFQHVKELPALLESMTRECEPFTLEAVGFSQRPRNVEGSYMPVFLAGESLARSVAALHSIPCYGFSHQEGHVAAGLWSLGLHTSQPFFALHLSGGTTELLEVTPDKDGHLDCRILSDTSDISLGQLIDRVGVAMGLPFPAGPAMEQLAVECGRPPFPIASSITEGRISLSGPETFLMGQVAQNTDPQWLSKSIFHFSGELLANMVKKAVPVDQPALLLTVGGVAANGILRLSLAEGLSDLPVTIHHATPVYCSDNAVGTAYLTIQKRGWWYPDQNPVGF